MFWVRINDLDIFCALFILRRIYFFLFDINLFCAEVDDAISHRKFLFASAKFSSCKCIIEFINVFA